jgi:hypothetical protein
VRQPRPCAGTDSQEKQVKRQIAKVKVQKDRKAPRQFAPEGEEKPHRNPRATKTSAQEWAIHLM